MTMESVHGRACEWMPARARMEFANPEKWSLKIRVIQISLSCIGDLEYDLDKNGGCKDEDASQRRRETDRRKP
jgi:hypothetical protein